jgi:hypothetical protein
MAAPSDRFVHRHVQLQSKRGVSYVLDLRPITSVKNQVHYHRACMMLAGIFVANLLRAFFIWVFIKYKVERNHLGV